MIRPHHERGRGFTLAEALLAAAILALAITAITMPFAAGAANEQVDGRQTLAVALAQEMMEEILAKPFDDPQGASSPGPETGETSRNRFDNVDDYHGYTETPGHIADGSGTVITGPAAAGLSRHVTAQYVYVTGQSTSGPATFIRVTVEVRHNNTPVVTLTRLVYKMPPGA
jgi:MSHA pilin protein MshD